MNQRRASDPAGTRREVLTGAAAAGLASALAVSTASSARATPASDDLVVAAATTRRIDASLVIRGDLVLGTGASITLAPGATLTLRGDLHAGTTRVFRGEGVVDLTQSRVLAARPEWWGAAPGDARVDSLAALQACVAAHQTTLLASGTYFISDTWAIDRPNRRIWGSGRVKDAGGTRIVLTRGGVGTVMLVGTRAAPPEINAYLRGVDLRWIELSRSAAAAFASDTPVALEVAHVLDCWFEALLANEHAVGFRLRGAVRSFLHDCRAFRSLAEDPQGRDIFVGFDMDGLTPPIVTGANASLYLIDCNASLGGPPRLAEAVGARLRGAMSDTTLVRFETGALATGVVLEGRLGAIGRSTEVNVRVDSPVLDQCTDTGIAISGLGPAAMVEVTSPYVTIAPGGRAGVSIARSGGSIRIAGGQIIGSSAPAATGILLDDVRGVSIDGATLFGCARPILARDATGFQITVLCLAEASGAGPVVTLERCRRGRLRPRLEGPAHAHAAGIAVDAASDALTIDTWGLDRTALASSAALVTRAGRPLTPVDASGSITIAPA